MGDTPAQILVVDDDPVILDVLREMLTDAGHVITTAGTARDALDVARRVPIDLVVLDVKLPGIDGLEVCRRLRQEHGASFAILLLSANDRRTAVPAFAAGADDYVGKPFEIDELLARIDALLRMHAGETSARRQADRLISLQRVSAAMLAQLDEDRVIRLVLAEARRLLDASGVALYEWDAEREVLRPRPVFAFELDLPTRERARGQGIVGLAFERREPVWENDYASWPDAPEDSRGLGVTAALAAPLILGDASIGVIAARRTGPSPRFGEDDARLLGLLAAPAAVALSNARLYAEQRAAAERAAERAAQLEAVLESMADGVLMADAAGTVTAANSSVTDLLGVEQRVLVGADLDTVLPPMRWPDGRPVAADELPFARIVDRRQRIDEREVIAEIGERERILVSITTPVLGADGALSGAVSVFRDVTESRHAAELSAQADKLRALGQMASGVAHDVNNLLATVLGRAELARLELERGELDVGRMGDALRLIEQAAEDGAQTVRRIQEFSRVRRDVPLAVVDVAGIVRDAVMLTQPQWRDRSHAAGVTIEVRLELDAGLHVEGEPAELREVLTNLILNAVDAMPAGGTISIAGRRRQDIVRLEVRDTGVGMPLAVARRVFEPFYTTKSEAGTGLGLAIVYGIVKRRGGQISVTSVPGEGTTFLLEFPATRMAPSERAKPRRLTGRSRRVLIVDDEASLVAMLARLLEAEGHQVSAYTSGAEALAAFDPARHDVVITDLGMADVNGLELAATLQSRSPATPVILATGWGNELDPDHPPPGVSTVLAKPYRVSVVLDAISAALQDARPAEATVAAEPPASGPVVAEPEVGQTGTRAPAR